MVRVCEKTSVSALICAKNEENSLREVILGVRPNVDEIIVVDGHSADGTAEAARSLGCVVLLDHGKGKGEAVRLGLAACSKYLVVLIDADGSHAPEDLQSLLSPLANETADLVIASRALGGSDDAEGFLTGVFRDLFGRLITRLINLRFGARLTDSQNGFRALRRDIVPLLGLSEDGFTIEQQMVIRALKRGMRIAEVPCLERRRSHGSSHISLIRHGPRYAWCLLREALTS